MRSRTAVTASNPVTTPKTTEAASTARAPISSMPIFG